MMKPIYFFCLSIIAILSFSCVKFVNDERYPFIDLNNCSQSKMNGTSVRVCFDSLIEDSRCPRNAICIWEGAARVKLSLIVNGQQESFELSTLNRSPHYRTDTVVLGYRVQLKNVYPYPGDTPYPPKAEVVITQ